MIGPKSSGLVAARIITAQPAWQLPMTHGLPSAALTRSALRGQSRHTADRLTLPVLTTDIGDGDAKKFASERRGDIDAAVKRMSADAVEAEKKLEKLSQAGTQSWSALMAALTETRTAFDRANEAAREAFKRAA
jgi:hypothetical protein